MSRIRLLGVFCVFPVLAAAPLGAVEPRPVEFSFDVKPILSDRCFVCHGPDEQARQADLRLDRPERAADVITPGNAAESELFRRITSSDPFERMPPVDSQLSLTAEEIDIIRRWIEQGASYSEHWSFVPLQEVRVPEVAGSDWAACEIDQFILQKMQAAGLSPAAEASPESLIRRVTFDLTGLPPTLEEIDAFLADPSADAYERIVDRLLASGHYGERLASDWLDVARYSDSYGFQVDRDRFVWPWRDWVIDAFNRNLPYDQFITEQLAGDLLPDATDDQILATTFCRLHPQESEGGSVPEEYRVEYVADRTQTVATGLLGLTLECARCHDHKYDPITQREYYQLTAFFDNIDEAGLYSYFTESIPTPTLMLTDEATRARLADLQADVAQAERRLADIAAARTEAFEDWLASQSADAASGERESPDGGGSPSASDLPKHAAAELIPGEIAYLDFEGPIAAPNAAVKGPAGQAIQLTGDHGVPLEVGNFRRFEPFSVALWLNTPDHKERAVIYHRSRAWTDAGSRGYELLLEDGRLSAALIHFWPGNALRVRTVEPIPIGEWLHVAVTYDGSSRAEGLQIFINGTPVPVDVVRDKLTKQITGGGGDHLTIGERFRDRGFTGGKVDEFRVFNRELTPVEVAHLHSGDALTALLPRQSSGGTARQSSGGTATGGRVRSEADGPASRDTGITSPGLPDGQTRPPNALTNAERRRLYAYFLSTADAEYRSQLSQLQKAREALADGLDGVQEIMVMRELDEPRPTYVLERGAYDARGERVFPAVPAVFPPLQEGAPHNRLGLARWLTSDEHPLTARVAVNRYWQMIFGEGLVRTPEDFGSQGERPTHPELLDWLALDFVKHGWNVKRLLKQMVMSATYRQSSWVSERTRELDPENRLWSRASSFRLPAEMLRDNALAASGLLVERIGGPPVKPYEIGMSFKPATPDTGEGLYRRSLYTYWKRTGPAPVMLTLDASKREVCRVRRERTSSPLQALVMMNGPQFVEAARVLAEDLLRKHGDDREAALAELFRRLTSRRPTPQELAILRELEDRQRKRFRERPEQALALLSVGAHPRDETCDTAHVAALTVVANTIFNFDECVTRR